MVEVRNRVETEILGTPALSHSAAELLPGFRNTYKPRRLFVARSGGRMVARAILSWRTAVVSPIATVNVEVQSDARGREIGTALLERMEALARDLNLTTVQSSVVHSADADGHRVEPLSGYGSLPGRDPGSASSHGTATPSNRSNGSASSTCPCPREHSLRSWRTRKSIPAPRTALYSGAAQPRTTGWRTLRCSRPA
ncbi:N-acetyltransferase family protein [uncultured Arthrobacter sp.]|uniref:GNAT family N-acetyltransferase n=1 Tax=uncultured Arthrobacter sp. TaxID=114050 RepID=UPI00345D2836